MIAASPQAAKGRAAFRDLAFEEISPGCKAEPAGEEAAVDFLEHRKNKRNHAVDAARRGLPVFKLPRNAKKPPPKEFFNVATDDPNKVFDLWTNPVSGKALDNNIGVSCDNVLVIDVDVKAGRLGEESLRRLIDHGLDITTLTSRTLSEGKHLYYGLPPGVQVANSVDKLGPGLDVRGYHGYVVAPGSSIDGREYRWVDPDAPMLTAPAWLIAEAGAPKQRATRDLTPLVELDQPAAIGAAIDYLVNRAPEAIENQGGDNTTIIVANGVIDFGLSVDGAFEAMRDHWNETKAIPSWDPDDLRTKVQNAWNSRTQPPGIRFPESAADQFSAAEGDEFVLDRGLPNKGSQRNIRLAICRLGVTVRHDVFQDRMTIDGLAECGPLLDDRAMERLWLTIDERYRFRPVKDFFWTVVGDEAHRHAYHPVRDYLDGLQWDGVPRIDKWLSTYAGAESTPYTDAVGALTLIAAVRRVRQPGCKFDEMPVLEGSQGTDKSTALRILAVREEWFSDDLPLANADSKRVIEALAGRWIVEAAELNGMRKGDVDHLKAFLSRTHDRARMSYDRLVTEVARQCIIVGTTNSEEYLRDSTGNRRFWPVAIEKFATDALRRDRDQLWAEAAVREAQRESIRLHRSLWAAAAGEQMERRIADPWEEMVAEHLAEFEGKLRTDDAWKLVGVAEGQRTQAHNQRLGEAMRGAGWKHTRRRDGGDRHYVYKKGEAEHWVRVERDQQNRVRVFSENEPGDAQLVVDFIFS